MRPIALEAALQIALRNCSEEVGERSVLCMTLVKGEACIKHTFWQRLAASRKEQMSPLMILVLF